MEIKNQIKPSLKFLGIMILKTIGLFLVTLSAILGKLILFYIGFLMVDLTPSIIKQTWNVTTKFVNQIFSQKK